MLAMEDEISGSPLVFISRISPSIHSQENECVVAPSFPPLLYE